MASSRGRRRGSSAQATVRGGVCGCGHGRTGTRRGARVDPAGRPYGDDRRGLVVPYAAWSDDPQRCRGRLRLEAARCGTAGVDDFRPHRWTRTFCSSGPAGVRLARSPPRRAAATSYLLDVAAMFSAFLAGPIDHASVLVGDAALRISDDQPDRRCRTRFHTRGESRPWCSDPRDRRLPARRGEDLRSLAVARTGPWHPRRCSQIRSGFGVDVWDWEPVRHGSRRQAASTRLALHGILQTDLMPAAAHCSRVIRPIPMAEICGAAFGPISCGPPRFRNSVVTRALRRSASHSLHRAGWPDLECALRIALWQPDLRRRRELRGV